MGFKRKYTTVALLLVLFVQGGVAMAQAAPVESKTPKVVTDCKDKIPKYPTLENPVTKQAEIDPSKIDLSLPYAGQYGLNFRIAFEKARTSYHAYVECVFENTVKALLGSAGGDTSGIFGANAPNLPEWSKPESACASNESKLAETLRGGRPEALLKPLQDAYNLYIDYISALYDRLSLKPPSNEGTVPDSFTAMVEKNKFFSILVENEKQDALVALDGAFIGLKEMRQAFVMHVHFQCMLKNLEFYRRALENLRKVISSLPSVIINASLSK